MFKFPTTLSECEIQAIIWRTLDKNKELEPRLEVPAILWDDKKQKNVVIRFDIVVFYKKTKDAICIIEVKRDKKEVGKNIRNAKQIREQFEKYSGFGIPVFHCFGAGGIVRVFNKVYIEKHKFEQNLAREDEYKIALEIEKFL